MNDPLRQVIYASHPYAHTAQEQCPDAWRSNFGELSFEAPVIISEWGIGSYSDIHTRRRPNSFCNTCRDMASALRSGPEIGLPHFGSYNYGFPRPQMSAIQGGVCRLSVTATRTFEIGTAR